MDANDIKNTVQNELPSITKNKDEIVKYLIEPLRQTIEAIDSDGLEVWVVWRKEEYAIVYRQKDDTFGLAFNNVVNNLVYLGDDGSLSDAYENLIRREEFADKRGRREENQSHSAGRKSYKRHK